MNKDEFTIEERNVDVGDGHTLYAQLWGKADSASPIIFLHGGPGSSCKDKHKLLFDPEQHKVLFFDQRGAGASTPYGSLQNNTTDELVADISKLADEFGLSNFSLLGGSWGSTLALVYAIREPKRVRQLYIRGVFTGRKAEADFMNKGGFRWFFPDIWETFLERTPEEHRKKAAEYHDQQILGDDEKAAKKSAYAVSEAEGSLLQLDERGTPEDFEEFDPIPTRIMQHYISQGCFLPENYILENAEKLKVPVFIVQGRYDMVCPPVTAYELHKRLPNSKIIWTIAGHSGADRESFSATKGLLAQHPE